MGKMFISRVKAVKAGQMKVNDFKTYTAPQSDLLIQTARHYSNLFEAPVLFYVVCILGILLNFNGTLFVTLAWIYVIARVAHTIIHTGSNVVRIRMRVFAFSWLALIVMWALVFVRAFEIAT